ncbi:MAG TPA: Uma2 family endonuclease [Pyrinomonadaceae bacterium]|nr:Uma2 family endonuclease [Pyrinomonadaceae bacterium]
MSTVAMEVEVNFSPLVHRYTLEEFWELPDPGDLSHYELIGGFLFMVPPPDPPHDDLDARLNKSLVIFLSENNIEGEVLHPQASIYRDVEEGTYLEPDMMYVSNELKNRMGKTRTSADIVFEYISRGSATYDRTTKADTYLALSVRELWLIDPVTVTIELRYATEHKGKPVWERRIYFKGEVAESRVLGGWRVSVDELFEGVV